MVAFNFKKEFAPRIEDGSKIGTIRQTLRCLPGDKMQLYTGQRTKQCRLIGIATCLHVSALRIHADHVQHIFGRSPVTVPMSKPDILAADALELFANNDGFDSWQALTDFFAKQYGLPADGYLHTWGDTFVKAAA